ncbi:MAG: type II toxin-antitoxin system PemK/MazF family toxin [Candidatus ainarchaeum sp.]|nr:type II toxin-antitoxin system PemK/MazF family toxin [Candidatus ainarchaeum sp.]
MIYSSGEVILANIQFSDLIGIKKRPAVVLFEELGNIVVAGITSNTKMKGIPLTKKDGAIKESVIKTNYIFTIANNLVEKKLFSLTKQKKIILYKELETKISKLKSPQ